MAGKRLTGWERRPSRGPAIAAATLPAELPFDRHALPNAGQIPRKSFNSITPDVAPFLLKVQTIALRRSAGSGDTRMASLFGQFWFPWALAAFAAVALVWARRRQRAAIEALISAMKAVAGRDDYSVRAAETGPRELRTLAAAFNGMIAGIEARVRDGVSSLRASEVQLQAVVEHSTNLFYAHSVDNMMTYVSPQSRTMLDCEPGEAMRRWTEWLTDAPINQKGIEATEAAIRTGCRQPPYELELRTKAGRGGWVEVNEAPVLRDGRCVQIVGALTDITARKRAEQDRERLHEQLRQAHKMEAVGRLAGGVAHDFNNLLGVITGYAEILEREGDPSAAPKVEQILRAAERAAALTRQLLAFSRRQVLDPKVLELSSVVRDMEKMLRRLIGEDVRLQVVAPPGLGTIRADPGQLEQVLMNLAVNARDAMPEGGSLKVAVDSVVLGEGESRDIPAGAYVRLSVTDSGEGIAAETLPHIYEPFFTTKAKGRGTGLGLATVQAIVQQSGGFIDVESEPGAGTTFRVYLPRLDEVPSARGAASAKAEPAARTGTVLLVEDDDTLRSLVGVMLRHAGYTVLEAPAGPQALSLAERHGGGIDVVLTDVVMPGLSGRHVGEMLTARRADVAVIYMSGYTEEVLQRNGIPEGSVVLNKPFTTAALLEAVQAVMAARPAPAQEPTPEPLLVSSWPHRHAWRAGANSFA